MLVFKGFLIGIGKILPGISGSVIAIGLNEYKNIITSLSKLSKNNMVYLIKIGIGMLVAIIIFSRILFDLIDSYKFYMFSLFMGLIMGTLPKMVSKVSKNNYIYSIIGFIVLSITDYIKIKVYPCIVVRGIIMGIVESISTIIPGISGTAILTNLGLYKEYLLRWSQIYDLGVFLRNLGFYVPFLVSLIGISILIIKGINYMLSKYEDKSNGIILGFMCSSIYLLFKRIDISNIFVFIMMLVIGFILGYFIDHISD